MTDNTILRIGTRGSPLALAQAHETQRRLEAAHPGLANRIEIVVIKTTGDIVLDRTLAEVGGKGLFTKEIDEALLGGAIDLAVHSMKDVPTWLPDGTMLAAILPREDPRDAFLSPRAASLAGLPPGSVVGTASLRRGAQILFRRPDLKVVPLRGNVQTRMRKLAEGEIDATLLALAGLRRLDLDGHARAVIEPDELLPAVAQGAIGIACRSDDAGTRDLLAALDHPPSRLRITAERALLAVLDGSCRTPIAALAELEGDRLRLSGLIVRPDGSELHDVQMEGAAADAEALGRAAGEELLGRTGPGFFDFKKD